MVEKSTQVLVFITGRNCEMFVEEALLSVANQCHPDVSVLYIDDGSEDQTLQLSKHMLDSLFPGRHELIRQQPARGKAFGICTYLRPAAANFDVIAVLDADSKLIDPRILSRLVDSHNHGHDVVWTNFITDRARKGNCADLNAEQPLRTQPLPVGTFFSFRANLLTNIPDCYFQYPDGRWLDAAANEALLLPLLDQTHRHQFLPIAAYCVTEHNPHTSPPELDRAANARCTALVRHKPELSRIDPTPSPIMSHSSTPSLIQPWETACAIHLTQAAPSLLSRLPQQDLLQLDPLLGVDVLQSLQNSDGRDILVLGDGPEVSMLISFTEHIDIRLCSVLASTAMHHGGSPQAYNERVQSWTTSWTEYTFNGEVAYLPDLSIIPAQARYSRVLLTAQAWGAMRFPMVAIAALSNHLDTTDLKIWVCGLQADELVSAKQTIAQLIPDLHIEVSPGRSQALILQSRVVAEAYT